MHGKDLAAAGILKWTPEGKVDFHSLRVCFVTLLYESGQDLKTIQTLARHSTPHLTANVYGRARQDRLETTTEALSNLLFPGPDSIIYPKRAAAGMESEVITDSCDEQDAGYHPVSP